MLSRKFETAKQSIEIIFVACIGILITLLFLTFVKAAVPEDHAWLSVNNFNAMPNEVIGPSPMVFEVSGTVPAFVITPIQYVTEWQKQPIKAGAEIIAGVTLLLGIIYLGLKRQFRQMSEEIFP